MGLPEAVVPWIVTLGMQEACVPFVQSFLRLMLSLLLVCSSCEGCAGALAARQCALATSALHAC